MWRSVPIDGDTETKKSRRTLALDPVDWTPRELRHSFVSVLSDAGLPGEQISHLVGHRGATVTELVYPGRAAEGPDSLVWLVELRGFEPLTSSMPSQSQPTDHRYSHPSI